MVSANRSAASASSAKNRVRCLRVHSALSIPPSRCGPHSSLSPILHNELPSRFLEPIGPEKL